MPSLEFERAAECRDLANALSKTIKKTRRFTKKWPVQSENNGLALDRLKRSFEFEKSPAYHRMF